MQKRHLTRAALLIVLYCFTDGASLAQTVVDLEPTPRSSRPEDFLVAGNTLFFSAGTPDRVLWAQPGASEPSTVANSPTSPFSLGVLGDDLIFAGWSDALGFELYRSDGTTVTLIADLNPGSASSLSAVYSNAVAFGNHVYFVADDGTTGYELYRTDGIVVEFVGDVNQGFDGSGFRSSFPKNFFAGDAFIYYAATNLVYGTEVYRTDGSNPLRFNISESGSSDPDNFVNHKERVYFIAESDSFGRELMRVSFSGPELAQDIRPGSDSSDPVYATEVGDVTVFFANDGLSGHEPWVLRDDTITQIADLRPGSEPSISYGLPNSVAPIEAGGFVYFVADDGVTGRELWRTDGTSVSQVGDLKSGPAGSDPSSLVAAGDRIYFFASGDAGPSLYSCDNQSVQRHNSTLRPTIFFDGRPYGALDDVAVGTEFAWLELDQQVLLDLVSGTNDSNAGELLHVGSKLLLVAEAEERERMVYSLEDDALLPVFASGDLGYSNPKNLASGSPDVLYFTAEDSIHGEEVWKSSVSTVEMLADVNPGSANSNARELTVVGDDLFFTADGGVFGREVWVSDSVSVRRVADIFPGSGDQEYHAPKYLTEFKNRLYFSHNDGFNRLLYSTDGESVDEVDAVRRNAARNPSNLLVVGSKLYFVATSDDAGFELWQTNGTTTEVVADIADGLASSNPSSLHAAGSTVYFSANDGIFGRELWKTDGENTVRLSDINTSGDSDPWSIVTANGAQYFIATNSSAEQSIYRHENGTIELLVDVPAQLLSSMLAFDRSLFFVAEDEAHGAELWRVDSSGVISVADTVPGPAGSDPRDLTVAGNRLYFVARDPELGVELQYVAAVIETGVDDALFDMNDGSETRLTLFPNPTNELITIQYELAETGLVAVEVFDVLGRRVAMVSNSVEAAGSRSKEVAVAGLRSGQYFIVLKTGRQRYTSRFVVSR